MNVLISFLMYLYMHLSWIYSQEWNCWLECMPGLIDETKFPQSCCITLQAHHQYMKFVIVPHHYQHLAILVFLNLDLLLAMQSYAITVISF